MTKGGKKITQRSWCLRWDLLWTSRRRRAGDSHPDDRRKSDATSSPAAPAGDQELVPAAPAAGGVSKKCLRCPPKTLPRVTNPRAKELPDPGNVLALGTLGQPNHVPTISSFTGRMEKPPTGAHHRGAAAAGGDEPVRTRRNLSRGRVYPRSEN